MNCTRRKFLLGLSSSSLALAVPGVARAVQLFTRHRSMAIECMDKRYRADSALTGLPTGFTDLDDMTSGLHAGDLIIVAARPSIGATSLVTNIAEHAAMGHGIPVAIFSARMPGSQFVMRLLASVGRVNAHRVRTGKLDNDDREKVAKAIAKLNEAPIYVDDTTARTALELGTYGRRLKDERGLGLVIVDDAHLMPHDDGGNDCTGDFSCITQALKALAQELNVPVLATMALPAEVEEREDRRPVMSDLRGYGTAMRDADMVLFIYRDEVYNHDSARRGHAEIGIAKQRNGPLGEVLLEFHGEHLRFDNCHATGFCRGLL